ncbi:MAG: recombinase RecA [Thermoprotei archaeon]|nr:MAG: recombinase RecA [Thermoprotei archaeon]
MARRRCVECVYYLKRSRYCILLGRRVEDPEHPPCLKQREEKAEKPEPRVKAMAKPVAADGPQASQARAVAQQAAVAKPSEAPPRVMAEALGFSYAPTGIRELDEALGGGFIRGKTYLVAGETGAGKTIFSLQFLLTGAVYYDEPGVYVAIDEPADQLLRGLRRFGWDVTPLIKEGKLVFLDMRTHFSKIYMRDERRKIEPKYVIESILRAAKRAKARRLVIDPVAPLIYGGTPDDVLYVREFLREMVFAIERVGSLTTVMTSEIPTGSKKLSRFGVEEFLASGIIVLGMEEVGGEILRVMYVRKARWAPAKPVKFVFDIEPGRGIVIKGLLRDFV